MDYHDRDLVLFYLHMYVHHIRLREFAAADEYWTELLRQRELSK